MKKAIVLTAMILSLIFSGCSGGFGTDSGPEESQDAGIVAAMIMADAVNRKQLIEKFFSISSARLGSLLRT